MTNEERNIIQDFITRVSGGPPASGQPGSVPATVAPLPAVDREADQLIGQLFTQYPDARYRLTQTAFVQEHALAAAQSRIERLEWELNQAKQIAAQPQQATPQGGFFSGLFSGGRSPQAPPQQQPVWNQGAPPYSQPPQGQPQFGGPPPQYQQPGMFQRQGSGFLGSALTTAAGVAGGMVAGNALMGLFHGGSSGIGAGLGGGMSGGGMSGGGGAPSPWATPAALPEPPIPPQNDVDSGSWDTSGATTSNDDWNRQDSAPASPPDNSPDNSSWGDSGGNDWGGSGGSDC